MGRRNTTDGLVLILLGIICLCHHTPIWCLPSKSHMAFSLQRPSKHPLETPLRIHYPSLPKRHRKLHTHIYQTPNTKYEKSKTLH